MNDVITVGMEVFLHHPVLRNWVGRVQEINGDVVRCRTTSETTKPEDSKMWEDEVLWNKDKLV